MTASVVPFLLGRYDLGVIVARTLRTAGIGESSLDDMIGTDILNERNPSVGLAAHHGCVDVRITAKADSQAEAIGLLNTMQDRLYEQIGDHVFGIDDATLEDVVLNLLHKHDLKINLTEAGLPGVISDKLVSDSCLVSANTFTHPQEIYSLHQLDSTQVSLKDLAVAAAKFSARKCAFRCLYLLAQLSGSRRECRY